MKKSKKMLLLVITFILLLGGTFGMLLSKTDLIKLKGAVTTTYYDWSSLTSVNKDFSYSTLVRTKNTKFYALTSGTVDRYYETTILYGNDPSPYFKIKANNSYAQILITNCWYDANGNLGHAIVKVTAKDLWTSSSDIIFGLRTFDKIGGTQSAPGWDYEHTASAYYIQENDPISFLLGAHKGEAELSLTYYTSAATFNNVAENCITTPLDSYSATGKHIACGTFTGGNVASSITKVNAFYYDVDIAAVSNSSKIFGSKEGVYPKNGTPTVYYATSGSGNLNAGGKTVKFKLAQSNSGLYINQNDVYTQYSDAATWLKYGISGIWYATSAAFYTTGLSGNLTMGYAGSDCNMGFMFLSPVPYKSDYSPTKTAPSSALTGENFTYSIKQYIPNNKRIADIGFGSVYSNLSNTGQLGSLEFSDCLPADVTRVSDPVVKKGDGTDVSSYFNFNTSTTASDCPDGRIRLQVYPYSYYSASDLNRLFTNTYLTMSFTARKKTAVSSSTSLTNNATVSTKYGTASTVSKSATAATSFTSPSVTYDCTTNGGTLKSNKSKTQYYNVSATVDLTNRCNAPSGKRFKKWSASSSSETTNSIISKGTMYTSNEINASSSLKNTTIYAIYENATAITVTATNQSKVYDGTALKADTTCSKTAGTLESGHSITCTCSGSITNVGSATKTLSTVVIKDSSGTDVTERYSVTKKNGTLTVTKADAVCPTLTAYSGVYDGTSHTITVSGGSGGTIQYKTASEADTAWSTTKRTRTNVGTGTVNTRVVGDSNHNTVTCANKTVTITARPITFTATNQSKEYDGTALNASEAGDYKCTVTSGSVVSGQTFTCTSTGSQTNVGSSTKTLSSAVIKSGSTDVSSNYEITRVNGTLTVTKKDAVCPTLTAYSGVYDGTSHTITVSGGSGGTIQYKTASQDDTAWGTTKPTRTNIGTGTVNTRVVGDSNHNTVTCANKTVTITARPVTFTATDQSKAYDGDPLEATETSPYNCTLTAGSVVSGQTFTCTSSGSQTNPGSSTKTLDSAVIKFGSSDVSNNYEITLIDGLLTVITSDATCPTIRNNVVTYDDAPHSINITGSASGGILYYSTSGPYPTIPISSYSTTLPTRTDVGTTVIFVMVKGDENHDDVYCGAAGVVVQERDATFTATNQSKVYDGDPLVATETSPYNCTLTAGSVVSGHTYSCVSSGSITNVGITTKVLESVTIESNSVDKTSNYNITKVDGELEVTTSVAGCPSITNYSGTYDGADHTITVGTPSYGTMEYKESTDTTWSTTLPVRKNVGTTTVNIRVKGDANHDDVTCSNGTIKVNTRKVTLKATDQEKVYDGTALEADETGDNKCTITSGSVVSGHTFTCTSTGSQTNAGSSTKTLSTVLIEDNTDDVTSNYNITKSNGTLTVTKADAVCPILVEYNDYYDGASHSITVTGGDGGTIEYKKSTQTVLAWSSSLPTRTTVGTTTVNVRVNADSNHNDASCPNTKIVVNKRPVTFTAIDQSKEYDGTALTASEDGDYKCIVTDGSVASGHTFTCSSTGSQTNAGSSTKTLSSATIKSGSSTVTSNYDVTLVNATLTVTKAPGICPTITDYSGEYNGSSHTITTGTVNSGTIQYKRSTASSWSTSKPTRTNAGSTFINVRVVGDENHDDITCSNGTITITPKEITVTATNQEKIYDGNTLDASEEIVDGVDYKCTISNGSLASGDSYSCESSGSIINVGTETKVLDDVNIYKGSTDVSGNYTISKVDGTLKVNKKSIIVSTSDQSKTYDTETLVAEDDCTPSSIAYGDSISCTNSGEIKYVGNTVKQIGNIEVINANSDDVTGNYDFTREDGTLTVSPISVDVTTTNQSKIYDGTALVATNDCTATGLQGEDYIQCTNTGTITNVGTEPKVIDTVLIRDVSGVDVTSNYTINKADKTLTVTKKELGCPSIDSYNELYDGAEHTITVGTLEWGTIEYKLEGSETWSTTLPTRTDAGTTVINIRVKGDENHDDATCSNGRIRISKRELTIEAKNQSKVYDGEYLEATEDSPYTCEVTSGSVVTGQNVVCTSSGRIRDVGTGTKSLDDVSIMVNDQDVSDNYIITRENGVLEITSAESECPTVTPYSGTYDGNSHTITVTGETGGIIEYKENDDIGWSTNIPERTVIGTTTINVRVKGDENHGDKSCPNSSITINKKEITVTTTDQDKPYDGTPLTATNDCASDDLIEGHSVVCLNDGSITDVGTETKEIKTVTIKDSNNVDVTENYDIESIDGTLEVTKIDSVCPTIDNYTGTYDGNSHSVTVGNVTFGTMEYRESENDEWSTSVPTRTNYGETTVYSRVKGDNNHNDKECSNSKITINKRQITVTTTNETKEYDGDPLIATPNTCSIKTGTTLGTNQRIKECTVDGSQTLVGESDKTITSVTIEDEEHTVIDNNNYEITYEKGKLTVTGEFEPEITKEVISDKDYYRFNDTVRYKITVRNTSRYKIQNIVVRENNPGAKFIDGEGYTKTNDNLVTIREIETLGTINIYAEYKVGKTETNKVENEAEIISAESEVGATLKDEEYKATSTFNLQSKIKICKEIRGASIPNKFQFKITGTENGFESDVSINKDECKSVYVDPGKYKVEEIIPQEYEITSVRGAITSNKGIINVVQGQDYEVTYTNEFTQKVYFHSYGRRENKVEGGE